MAKQPKDGALNDQQERFCQEYLKDLNAKASAARAGYSEKTAQEQGSRLLSHVKVQGRIQELMEERAKRVQVDSDQILAELKRLGYSNIRGLYNENGTVKHPTEWPDELAAAVASIEVEETFERQGKELVWTGFTKKVKFWNKPQSLELLGKHKKLFTDRVEHSGKVTLEELVAGENGAKDPDAG